MTKKKVVSSGRYVKGDKVGARRQGPGGREYAGTTLAQWACSSCGRADIPGDVKTCPSCGSPKESDEHYRPPEEQGKYVTEQELAQMAVDPDQHLSDQECPYCRGKLKPGTTTCPRCGGTIDDVAYTTRECPACKTETTALICPNCGGETVSKHPVPAPTRRPRKKVVPAKTPAPEPTVDRLRRLLPFAAGGIGVLLFGFLLFVLFRPRVEVARVSHVSWERSIAVEEHQYNQRGGWELPSDADLVSTEERVHHHQQVIDHYEEVCEWVDVIDHYETKCHTEEECHTESVYSHTDVVCYDDGTCDEHDVYETERVCEDVRVCSDEPVYRQEEQCREEPVYRDQPIYQTWYEYMIWEWMTVAPRVASGEDNRPRWPSSDLPEDQRECGRREVYKVLFTGRKERTYTYRPHDPEAFCKYVPGSAWRIKRNALTVVDVLGPAP